MERRHFQCRWISSFSEAVTEYFMIQQMLYSKTNFQRTSHCFFSSWCVTEEIGSAIKLCFVFYFQLSLFFLKLNNENESFRRTQSYKMSRRIFPELIIKSYNDKVILAERAQKLSWPGKVVIANYNLLIYFTTRTV